MLQTRTLRPTPRMSRYVNRKIICLQPNSIETLIIEALTRLNYGRGSTKFCVDQFIKTTYPGTKKSDITRAVRNGLKNGVLEQPNGPDGLIKIAESAPSFTRYMRSNRANLERQGMVRRYRPTTPSSIKVLQHSHSRQNQIHRTKGVNNGFGTKTKRVKDFIVDQYFKGKNALEDTISKAIDEAI